VCGDRRSEHRFGEERIPPQSEMPQEKSQPIESDPHPSSSDTSGDDTPHRFDPETQISVPRCSSGGSAATDAFRPISLRLSVSEVNHSTEDLLGLQSLPRHDSVSDNDRQGEDDPHPRGLKTLSRKVSFGKVVSYEAPDDGARPPNSTMLGGEEWSYERLASAMRGQGATSSLPLRTTKLGLRHFHNSFRGEDLLEWISVNTKISCTAEAAKEAQGMVNSHVIEPCEHNAGHRFHRDGLYRLWSDSRRVHGGRQHEDILNGRVAWVGRSRHPTEAIDDLLYQLMVLYNNKAHDLQAIKRSSSFQAFVEGTGELQRVDLGLLEDEEERTACFINLYNTLALHARVFCPHEGRANRDRFFNKLCYDIGGELFALNDIEQGLLGANALISGSFRGTPRFPRGDSRSRWCLKRTDTEACLAVSHLCADSAPVHAYMKSDLSLQLKGACSEALKEVFITPCNEVKLPHRCKKAFSGLTDDVVIEFLKSHLSPDQGALISSCPRLLFMSNDRPAIRPYVCPL